MEDENEITKKKAKAQKCRVIALHQMNMHPITTNTYNLTKKQKAHFFEVVKLLFEKPDEDVQALFNDACEEAVFVDGPKMDYTSYPIYAQNTN
jgi:hypothetical protein